MEQDKYGVVLKTCHRFNLCIRFVSCGASFCMASRLMDCMLPESAISYYGGCTEAVASNYTRIVCAYSCKSLQIFHQNSGAFRLHWIPRLIKGCHAWIWEFDFTGKDLLRTFTWRTSTDPTRGSYSLTSSKRPRLTPHAHARIGSRGRGALHVRTECPRTTVTNFIRFYCIFGRVLILFFRSERRK